MLLQSSDLDTNIPPPILKKNDCKEVTLPQTKVDALRSKLKWMPEVDREHYKTILPQEVIKQRKRKANN